MPSTRLPSALSSGALLVRLNGTQGGADHSASRPEARAPNAHAPRVATPGEGRQRGAKAAPVTAGSGSYTAAQDDQRGVECKDQDAYMRGEFGRCGVDHAARDAGLLARRAANCRRIL